METILAEKPDVVVIATGARPNLPNVPGLEAALQGGSAMTIDDVLQRNQSALPPGPVVVWGAGEGIELALDIKRSGHPVRLLDSNPALKPANYIGSRAKWVLGWAAQAELQVESGLTLVSVGADHVRVKKADGQEESIEFSTLIVAPAAKPTTLCRRNCTARESLCR